MRKVNFFIRLGEVPPNEQSTEYHGNGDGQHAAKKLNILSVYHCSFKNGRYSIVLPNPLTPTTLDTLYGLLQYSTRKVYLVIGDIVGYGSDNEPLIKNVEIVKEISLK